MQPIPDIEPGLFLMIPQLSSSLLSVHFPQLGKQIFQH
jgi:hypothetical protein